MTLELTYKQICTELKNRNIEFSTQENAMLNNSHSLEKLHELCVLKGRLKNINHYKPFLKYADIMYKTRYPIHVAESQKNLSTTFSKGISFSIYNIYLFDDLISQLDTDIVDLTGDHKSAILFAALSHTNTHHSTSFFHHNGIFYEKIDNYLHLLDPKIPQQLDSIELLKTNRQKLLKSDSVYLGGDIKFRKDEPLAEFAELYGS